MVNKINCFHLFRFTINLDQIWHFERTTCERERAVSDLIQISDDKKSLQKFPPMIDLNIQNRWHLNTAYILILSPKDGVNNYSDIHAHWGLEILSLVQWLSAGRAGLPSQRGRAPFVLEIFPGWSDSLELLMWDSELFLC